MIRRPPRSTLFPTRRSSDLPIRSLGNIGRAPARDQRTLHEHLHHRAVGELGSEQPWYSASSVGASMSDLVAQDRKSTRLNSSHMSISYAVFCLKKKKTHSTQ